MNAIPASGLDPSSQTGGYVPANAPAGGLHYTDGAYMYDRFFHDGFPYRFAPLRGSPNDDNAIKLKPTDHPGGPARQLRDRLSFEPAR